jgi:chemotaxis family two-component system response regulator Rcp1
MRKADSHAVEILLVEDNPGDVDLVIDAFKESLFRHRLSVVGDGVDAMTFLHKADVHAGAPTPDLILLDLNLPRKDGREVLNEIKKDPELQHIPVVVLSSSEAERDLLFSYRLHANCFVTKPVDLEEFFAAVRAIEQFWFVVAKLPRQARG